MFTKPYDALGLLEDCVKMLDVQILTRPPSCLKFGFAQQESVLAAALEGLPVA